MLFKLRTEMVDLKDKMRRSYNCEDCAENILESKDIRQGKDLSDNRDLVKYYREVLLRREKKQKKD